MKKSLLLAFAFLSAWTAFSQPNRQTGNSTSSGLEKITLEQLQDKNYKLSPQIRKELSQYVGSLIDPCGYWSIEAFGTLELKLNEQSKTLREGPYLNHFVFPADKDFYFNVPNKVTGHDPITAFDIIFSDENNKQYTFDGLAKQPINLHEGLYFVEFKAYTDKIGSDKVKRRIQYASVRGWATGRKESVNPAVAVIVEQPNIQKQEEPIKEPPKPEEKQKEQVIINETITVNNNYPPPETQKEPVSEPKKTSLDNLLFIRSSGFTEKMNNQPYFDGFSIGIGGKGFLAPCFYFGGSFDTFFNQFTSVPGDFRKYLIKVQGKAKGIIPITADVGFIASIGLEGSNEMADIRYDAVKAWIEEAKAGFTGAFGLNAKFFDIIATGSLGAGASGDSFQGEDALFYWTFKANPELHFPIGLKDDIRIGYRFKFTDEQQEVRGVPRDKTCQEHRVYLAFPIGDRFGIKLHGDYTIVEGAANKNENLCGGAEFRFRF